MTGYTDAEGSFSYSLPKSKTKTGQAVKPSFSIGAHNNPVNQQLLEDFQTFFGGGRIYLSDNQLYYRVFDLETLLKVRDHFLTYRLESTKRIYFELWCQVLEMIVTTFNSQREGFLEIVAIKSLFPKG